MTITELIFKLKQMYFKHGDVIVRINDDKESECNKVIFLDLNEEKKLHPEPHFCLMG